MIYCLYYTACRAGTPCATPCVDVGLYYIYAGMWYRPTTLHGIGDFEFHGRRFEFHGEGYTLTPISAPVFVM